MFEFLYLYQLARDPIEVFARTLINRRPRRMTGDDSPPRDHRCCHGDMTGGDK